MAITLAAVILPLSILTTFKLTGIIPEPVAPEVTVVDTVNWNMTRPLNPDGGVYNIGEMVENTYADNEATIRVRVNIAEYENDPYPTMGPYFGRDGVVFTVFANFSISKGFGVSLVIKYLTMDDNATIYVQTSSYAVIQENASITDIKWFGTNKNEAYAKTEILNSPCYLGIQAYWVFDDQSTINHALNVTLEATYFNEAAYKKVVLPVTLEMLIPSG
jgi:hypothetical protein